MRLDKFLKASRLIKQRSRGKELCESQAIKLNDSVAKPGAKVKAGDMLELTIGDRRIKVRALEIPERNVSKESDRSLGEIIEDIQLDENW